VNSSCDSSLVSVTQGVSRLSTDSTVDAGRRNKVHHMIMSDETYCTVEVHGRVAVDKTRNISHDIQHVRNPRPAVDVGVRAAVANIDSKNSSHVKSSPATPA
jgi:hypothetical protein